MMEWVNNYFIMHLGHSVLVIKQPATHVYKFETLAIFPLFTYIIVSSCEVVLYNNSHCNSIVS